MSLADASGRPSGISSHRPFDFDASALATAVRDGSLKAVDAMERTLERADETEPVVGAYLRRFDDARDRAAALDRRRRSGERLGPLAGVPVAIKDNLAVAGRRLSCGSRMLDSYVSPFTATAVERLLDADAVLVGATNLDEFAMGSSCETSAFQTTRNPWCLDRVPGGSSGGSAAAVAAGSAFLALGSDTGGSLRQPASFCGVWGLRPTYGRVSRHGLVAFASSLDQIGPLALSVRDLALAYRVLAGPDTHDATTLGDPVPTVVFDDSPRLDGLRFGVVRELAPEPGDDPIFDSALDRLTDLGATRIDLSLPNAAAAVACYTVLAACEASSNLARFDGIRFGRRASNPPGQPPIDRLEAVIRRSRSEGFGDEVKRRILLGTFALSAGAAEAYYPRAQGVRAALVLQLRQAFARVNVLAGPTTPGGAFALGERTQDPRAMVLSDVWTTPAALAGLPALSVPSGLDTEGLPRGLHLVGPALDEATVLQVGAAFESTVGWSVAPPFAESGPPATPSNDRRDPQSAPTVR